jgi:hypothetical protein
MNATFRVKELFLPCLDATPARLTPGRWTDPAALALLSEGPGNRIGPYKLFNGSAKASKRVGALVAATRSRHNFPASFQLVSSTCLTATSRTTGAATGVGVGVPFFGP